MPTADDDAQERFYARPQDGESWEEFGQRATEGILDLIRRHRDEEPAPLAPDDPARLRALARLALLRGEQDGTDYP